MGEIEDEFARAEELYNRLKAITESRGVVPASKPIKEVVVEQVYNTIKKNDVYFVNLNRLTFSIDENVNAALNGNFNVNNQFIPFITNSNPKDRVFSTFETNLALTSQAIKSLVLIKEVRGTLVDILIDLVGDRLVSGTLRVPMFCILTISIDNLISAITKFGTTSELPRRYTDEELHTAMQHHTNLYLESLQIRRANQKTYEEQLAAAVLRNNTFNEDIAKVLSRVYPNNWSWVIDSELSNSDNKEFIIKWDEIEIRNSNMSGKTHIIKDFYIIVKFTKDPTSLNGYRISSSLRAFRGKVTYAEYCSRYIHSHTTTGTDGIGSCCLGSGPLPNLLANLTMEFNIDRFELLLHLLDSYVKWESIEGTPYTQFERITIRSINNINLIPNKVELESIYRLAINLISELPLKIISLADLKYYQIDKSDPEFINHILSATPIRFRKYRDVNGAEIEMNQNYTNDDVRNANATTAASICTFRGDQIKYTIMPNEYEDNMKNTLKEYPSFYIINHIVDHIELKVNEYLNKKETYEFSR